MIFTEESLLVVLYSLDLDNLDALTVEHFILHLFFDLESEWLAELVKHEELRAYHDEDVIVHCEGAEVHLLLEEGILVEQVYLLLHYERRLKYRESYLAFNLFHDLALAVPQTVIVHLDSVYSALVLHYSYLGLEINVLFETLYLVLDSEIYV